MLGTYQYFSEINFEYHTHSFGAISLCDPRFAPSQPPSIEEMKKTLSAMMENYAATMSDLRAKTWLAHGPLLGCHWNQKFLAWDNDIDVQMSIETLAGLAPNNMSEYRYPVASADKLRVYPLDINPHSNLVSTQDVANKIDRRWIDTSNGKYIDITTVHVSPGKTEQAPFDQGVLFSKDGHRFLSEDLFPLEDASFEA
ncbi:mannosyltransferase [Exophiala xenobiotica]|nr:mannosyltransferase [Exophiala xenobiotica]KAK5263211.1 mannosyltransferase [Exophiala xenobiotica]KAK5332505.1 mannosyltransferase [Exophiala xenobiotica]KAK5431530.1 mannosyltransferase [Exophiala xenobiotica]